MSGSQIELGSGVGERKVKPTLLLVIPSITSYFTFLEELCVYLKEEGWDVHLATDPRHIAAIDCYKRAVIGTIHAVGIPRGMKIRQHWRASRALRQVVKEVRPDVIHIHFSSAIFATALSGLSRDAPVIGTVHGTNSPLTRGIFKWVLRAAEFFAFRQLDFLYVLNMSDIVYIRKWHLTKDVRTYKSMGLGCRLDVFNSEKYPRDVQEKKRSELGLGQDTFIFIFIGRRTQFKGFALTVRAYLGFAKSVPDSRLILVGEKDPLHATGLTTFEEKLLAESVNILDIGWCETVAEYLAISDVNVFPSEREGMPVNLMESLAMGIPVITIDSRGCNEVVRDGVDGIVLQGTRTLEHVAPNALCDAMMRLYENRNELKKMSQNAVARRNSFSREKWVEEQVAIYKGIVALPRA